MEVDAVSKKCILIQKVDNISYDQTFQENIKRHNSFTSPNRRAPISKRAGRERCHSYHAPTIKNPKSSVPTKSKENCLEVPRVSF